MWIIIIIILLISFLLFDAYEQFMVNRCLSQIPSVSHIPIIGGILQLSKFSPNNLHLKFKEFVERFGKTFYARIFGSVIIVTCESRYVEALLSSHHHVRKHMIYNLLRPWLGNGLLLSTDKKWHRMRKIITPTFHFQILERFVDVFDHQSNILVQKLMQYSDGETIVDIYPYMGLATMDIIAETAMGVQINAQHCSKSDFVQAVKTVTDILALRFVRPHLSFTRFFRFFSPRKYEQQVEGIRIMHEFTDSIIERKRNEHIDCLERPGCYKPESEYEKKKALLDVLLQASFEGQNLTDQEIRDEVNTFMFEGHDTTTSATSFCLYLLSRHPECQQKLYEEITTQFPPNIESTIKLSDLQTLKYLNCVVKESLRLYPPVPAIGRWVREESQLDDLCLPAGSNIIVLIWQILRDPNIFDEPERFRPDRHIDPNPRAQAFSNIPFSGGPRNCIGQRFAQYEMKTIIIKLLLRYELMPIGEAVQPFISIVLRSENGIQLGFKLRHSHIYEINEPNQILV